MSQAIAKRVRRTLLNPLNRLGADLERLLSHRAFTGA